MLCVCSGHRILYTVLYSIYYLDHTLGLVWEDELTEGLSWCSGCVVVACVSTLITVLGRNHCVVSAFSCICTVESRQR